MATKDLSLKDHPNFKGNSWKEEKDCYIGTDKYGNSFIIDKEDYEEVSKHCWTSNGKRKAKNGHYFSSRMSRKSENGHEMKMLHRFIWELHNGKLSKEIMIDHIDRNPYNNRLSNLRTTNKSLNSVNTDLRANNTSGVTGISFSSKENKWRAYINFKGERFEIGRFSIVENAIKARLEAEIKFYGDKAPQKHLFEQYGVAL